MAASGSHISICSPATRAYDKHIVRCRSSRYQSADTLRKGLPSIAGGKQICSVRSFRSKSTETLWQFSSTGFRRSGTYRAAVIAMSKPVIQFIRGTDELTVPDVSLTRSRDQTNGVATFVFEQPSIFDSSRDLGDITGFYMIDEEGVLQSVDVSAKFVNGKPAKIEARYVMRNPKEWDRFMRFMERYATENSLGFVKK